ncbi:MAG: hypothetical protein HRU17_00235 [Polyangiaceae bacterium]|nr:hypothetical protein [Polyangiaceae bacterium]
MQLRNRLNIGLILAGGLAFAACGDDDDATKAALPDGGQLDASGFLSPEELDALKQQIAALEALVAAAADGGTANSSEISALQDRIGDLNEQLAAALGDGGSVQNAIDDLLACEESNTCQTLADSVAGLGAISDAYCTWMFGCCSEDQVDYGVGTVFATLESCQSSYRGMLANGTFQDPHIKGGVVYEMAWRAKYALQDIQRYATAIQQGRATLDSDAVAACASEVSAIGCYERYYNWTCAAGSLPSCVDLLVGTQLDGEGCSSHPECVDGLICLGLDEYGGYGTAQGICVAELAVGEPCLYNSGCETRQEDRLYCDQRTNTCQEAPGLGEACEFEDPTFQNASLWDLVVPCSGELSCSLTTQTCVSLCEAGAECNYYDFSSETDNFSCVDGMRCDATTFAAGQNGSFGFCAPPKTIGETADYDSECETWSRNAGVCQGKGGEDCEIDLDCATNVCTEEKKCTKFCGSLLTDACNADEICVDEECQAAKITTGGDCSLDAHCAQGACIGDICVDPVGTSGACAGNDALCPASEFCNASDVCAAIAQPAGEACSDWLHCASERCDLGGTNQCVADGTKKSEGAPCAADVEDAGIQNMAAALDECRKGLFCLPNAPGPDGGITGVCTALFGQGESCDSGLFGVPQCEGNQLCTPFNNTGKCPIISATASQQLSCVLSDIQYATATPVNIR